MARIARRSGVAEDARRQGVEAEQLSRDFASVRFLLNEIEECIVRKGPSTRLALIAND